MSSNNVYITADPHFWHYNIIGYQNRPFKTIEEMNEKLITNWNEVVQPDDSIIVLGDFCLSGPAKMRDILDALNGHKMLILGNHDNRTKEWYLNNGFEMVEKIFNVPTKYGIVTLTHEPMIRDDSNRKEINIHGHCHGDAPLWDHGYNFCVSVENTKYKPILLSKVFDTKVRL